MGHSDLIITWKALMILDGSDLTRIGIMLMMLSPIKFHLPYNANKRVLPMESDNRGRTK